MCSDSGVQNSFITFNSPLCFIIHPEVKVTPFLSVAGNGHPQEYSFSAFSCGWLPNFETQIKPMRGREVKRGVKVDSKVFLMVLQMAVTISQILQKHKNNPQYWPNLSQSGASTISQSGVDWLVASGVVPIYPLQLTLHISDRVWLCHQDLLLKKGEACIPPQTQPGIPCFVQVERGATLLPIAYVAFTDVELRFNSGYLDEVSMVSLSARVLEVLPW